MTNNNKKEDIQEEIENLEIMWLTKLTTCIKASQFLCPWSDVLLILHTIFSFPWLIWTITGQAEKQGKATILVDYTAKQRPFSQYIKAK